MRKQIKILFVCHGNICRSPTCEFVLKDLVARAGVADHFLIASAATTNDDTGSGMHYAAEQLLKRKGIRVGWHIAVKMTREDYDRYDYLIGMDRENIRHMNYICGGDPDGKIYKLMEFAGQNRDVADPWYTNDFERAYNDIVEGCTALLNKLLEEENL